MHYLKNKRSKNNFFCNILIRFPCADLNNPIIFVLTVQIFHDRKNHIPWIAGIKCVLCKIWHYKTVVT